MADEKKVRHFQHVGDGGHSDLGHTGTTSSTGNVVESTAPLDELFPDRFVVIPDPIKPVVPAKK